MKLKFWYEPQAEVEFTLKEIDTLITLSEEHYDYKCKQLSQYDPSTRKNGVLLGMRHRLKVLSIGQHSKDAIVTHCLDIQTSNLLTKIAEDRAGSKFDAELFLKLMGITKALNDEWRRLNAENMGGHI